MTLSLMKTAYAYIREQIMLGEFMPGTLLSENELAETLGMSRTPVRSAISQLESEGFLMPLKNRGVLVREMSAKEAIDMSEVMYTFQQYALDCMEARSELPDMKQLEAHLAQQMEATACGAYHLYVEHALLFTRCIVAATNNDVMLQTMDTIRDKLSMYSNIGYKKTPHEPHYSGNPLNQAVYEALLARNYGQARDLFKQSYSYNRERMIRWGRM